MSSPRFKPADPVDFLVIGAGAAGGVMAKALSVAGFRVVVRSRVPTCARRTIRTTRSSTLSSRA